MDYTHYMKMALEQADAALAAGEFPVGCVMVYQDSLLVSGARSGTQGESPNEIDHAEMVALRRLNDSETGIDGSQISVFSTMEPCLMCFAALLLRGIGQIIFAYEDIMGGGTACDLSHLPPLYQNHRTRIVPNVLRSESLKRFKAFFSNPANDYWRDSLLARYTLTQ